MTAWAIVQARLGSSRLPGKVLRPLAGRPVLWHIVHRLRACTSLDGIIVATSTSATDDPLVAFCENEGVRIFRGSEDDVLSRYYEAARSVGASIVVRVCGDSPLVDPPTIDRQVQALRAHPEADHAAAEPTPEPVIHEGFGAVTMRCLQKLVDEVPDHPAAREHVTGYLQVDPHFVRMVTIPIERECWCEARVSVDTPADLRFLETVYERLGAPAGDADVREVVRLLRAEPELVAINMHVARKHLDVRDDRVLLRCDGDGSIGLGHVSRCAALGDALREGHACGAIFAMRSGAAGFAMAEARGFRVERGQDVDDEREGEWIERLVRETNARAIVLDVRTPLPRAAVERLRAITTVVALDDGSDRRLAAHLAVLPPVPQTRALAWDGFAGDKIVGWDHMPMRLSLRDVRRPAPGAAARLLVTMGGADPAGLLPRVVKSIDALDAPFEGVALAGKAFSHDAALDAALSGARHVWKVLRDVDDVVPLFASADLAIAAYGVTAHELCAVGTPAVLVSLTPDHEQSASALVDAGAALSAGLPDAALESRIAAHAARLICAPEQRARMGASARALIDGRGAERLARRIVELIRR